MTATQRASLFERRAEELRLDIARTAMGIFISDGDTTATVERIAAEAGVAPRTFYRHFAVKEDVVLPLFRRSSERIAASIRDAPDGQDVVTVLVEAFRNDLDPSTLAPQRRAFLALMFSNPQYRMRWIEVDGFLRDAVAALLAARVPGGTSDDGGQFVHELAAELIAHSARRAFEEWLIGDPEPGLDGLLRCGFELVLAGLTASVVAR